MAETAEAEVIRLHKIIDALMDRAERSTSVQSSDFGLFETTAILEERVHRRTAELEAALIENEKVTGDLRDLQERMLEQSTHDALTGLYNRRFLDDSFARELLLAERSGQPVSVIMSDLDNFKLVNDRHGHLAGDKVLRVFGDMVKQHARASDVFCRYGGEEFLLILPGLGKNGALERAEQLRAATEALTVFHGGARIEITSSFGIAAFPVDGRTSDQLVAAADAALYSAKTAGRNRVRSASAPPQIEPVEIPPNTP